MFDNLKAAFREAFEKGSNGTKFEEVDWPKFWEIFLIGHPDVRPEWENKMLEKNPTLFWLILTTCLVGGTYLCWRIYSPLLWPTELLPPVIVPEALPPAPGPPLTDFELRRLGA